MVASTESQPNRQWSGPWCQMTGALMLPSVRPGCTEDGELNYCMDAYETWMSKRQLAVKCQKCRMKKVNWKERLKVRNLTYWLGLKTVFGGWTTQHSAFSPSINIGISLVMHLSIPLDSGLETFLDPQCRIQKDTTQTSCWTIGCQTSQGEEFGQGSRHNGKNKVSLESGQGVLEGRDGPLRSLEARRKQWCWELRGAFSEEVGVSPGSRLPLLSGVWFWEEFGWWIG